MNAPTGFETVPRVRKLRRDPLWPLLRRALPTPRADPADPVRSELGEFEAVEFALLHMTAEEWSVSTGESGGGSLAEVLRTGSPQLRALNRRVFGG